MKRKHMPLLREVTHAGLVVENLAAPLWGRTAPLPEESSEIGYLALGTTAVAMTQHLDHQRHGAPWERRWICAPESPDAVKIIAFAYRSVARNAISTYAEFGVSAIEVTKEDLPFLVEDSHQILLAEDGDPILHSFGLRLGLVQEWLRQRHYEEIIQCLKDPKSARDACWLLNERDKLFGRQVVVDINELPWSVRVREWDILPCKAVHRDGNAVFFEGEWKFMPLTVFWRRYCKALMTPHADLPGTWRFQLMLANRVKEQEVEFVDDEDLPSFIYESDDADPAS